MQKGQVCFKNLNHLTVKLIDPSKVELAPLSFVLLHVVPEEETIGLDF